MKKQKAHNFFNEKNLPSQIKNRGFQKPKQVPRTGIYRNFPQVYNHSPYSAKQSKSQNKKDIGSNGSKQKYPYYYGSKAKENDQSKKALINLKELSSSTQVISDINDHKMQTQSKNASKSINKDYKSVYKTKNQSNQIDPKTKKILSKNGRQCSYFKKVHMMPLTPHVIQMRAEIQKRFRRSALRDFKYEANYIINQIPTVHFQQKTVNKQKLENNQQSKEIHLTTKVNNEIDKEKSQNSQKSQNMEDYSFLSHLKIVDLKQFQKIKESLQDEDRKATQSFKRQNLRVKTELSYHGNKLIDKTTPNSSKNKDLKSIGHIPGHGRQWKFASLIANGIQSTKSAKGRNLKPNSYRTLQPRNIRQIQSIGKQKRNKNIGSFRRFEDHSTGISQATPKLKQKVKTPRRQKYDWI